MTHFVQVIWLQVKNKAVEMLMNDVGEKFMSVKTFKSMNVVDNKQDARFMFLWDPKFG